MKHKVLYRTTVFTASLAVLLTLVPILQAGTPLTCFPFQIGNARSLPWASSGDHQNWNAPDRNYDTSRLVSDTLRILDDKSPVIVRMETIRRAALYGRENAGAAADLLASLKARSLNGEKSGDHALFLFDYGYMLETYRQISLFQGDRKSMNAGGESGFPYVLGALALRGGDAEMEFAAALIASWPRQKEYEEHFRKAVSGADGDRLLADNLVSHFSYRGTTLTELRASASDKP